MDIRRWRIEKRIITGSLNSAIDSGRMKSVFGNRVFTGRHHTVDEIRR